MGFEGYGIYFSILEMLFDEENHLCIDDYDDLAFALNCDKDKVKRVIEEFDLFTIDDNCFWSERLKKTIDEIEERSQTAKRNAEKRWKRNASAKQEDNTSIETPILVNESKVNESKENKIKLNNSNNIDKRFENFKKEITNIEGFDEHKDNFIDYWTEKNKSQTKMKYEMERTWDSKRRLSRWANNNFSSNGNGKPKYKDYYDAFFMKNLPPQEQVEYTKHLKKLGWESTYSPNAGQIWKLKK